jgi:hypothetical protein
MNAKYRSNTKRMILALHGRVTVECGNEVVGYFDSGLRSSAMEKQVPRARKKALGMTKIKINNWPLVPEMVRGWIFTSCVALRGYNGVTIFPIQLGFEAGLRRIV